MDARQFTLIDVAGTPYEMGFQHGSRHRELVAHSIETIAHIFSKRAGGISAERAVELANRSIPDARDYAPDLVEEVRGIADGSGFTFEQIYMLNASLDLLGIIGSLDGRGEPINCSTYGVSAPATADGDVYLGWNADDNERWLPSCVVIRVRPTDGMPCLTWTFAGFVGRPGLGPHVALGANSIGVADGWTGVPYPFLCRKALAQKSVADAIAVMTSARRLCGMNYMIADADGNVADLEIGPRDHAVIAAENGWVTHTNHCCDLSMKRLQWAKDGSPRLANTETRLRRWNEMVPPKVGSLSLADLQSMHRDHANGADSICRHAVTPDFGMTLTAMLCAPRQRKMLVAYGPPCENDFVEYTI